MAFNVPALQHPIDPKAIEPGLLDGDDLIVSTGPGVRFLLELCQPLEQASDIAGRNGVRRHRLSAPR